MKTRLRRIRIVNGRRHDEIIVVSDPPAEELVSPLPVPANFLMGDATPDAQVIEMPTEVYELAIVATGRYPFIDEKVYLFDRTSQAMLRLPGGTYEPMTDCGH